MPFVAAKLAGAEPTPPPPLVQLTYFTAREANAVRDELPEGQRGKRISIPLWQLNVPFGYVRAKDGKYFDVPAHTGNVAIYSNHTDLATIPGFLWGVLAPFGRQMRPALLHDRRCDLAHGKQTLADHEPDSAKADRLHESALATRKEADYLFREALGAEGVGPTRRLIFWAGVSFGRFLGYQRKRGLMLALAVAVSTLVILRAAALSTHSSVWSANRWIFDCRFWTAVGALFVVLLVISRRLLLAAVLPLIAVLIAVLLAGTGPHDAGWLHSWRVHLVVLVVALFVAVIVGSFTDVRVALIGLVISPIIVAVVIVTMIAELVFALPDLRTKVAAEGGGLGPLMPTMLRWRLR